MSAREPMPTLEGFRILKEQRDDLLAALEACVVALQLESTRALAPYESAYKPLRDNARAVCKRARGEASV